MDIQSTVNDKCYRGIYAGEGIIDGTIGYRINLGTPLR